jgi:RHS repeat-associated protein
MRILCIGYMPGIRWPNFFLSAHSVSPMKRRHAEQPREAPPTILGGGRRRRKYIGQFVDDSSLSYLNARYYNGTQGQFTSQDPVFIGEPQQQTLQDPQSLNAYSYSEDNPITKSER